MKSGTCPKCQSNTVYQRSIPGGYRSALFFAFDAVVRLEDYICGSCGYVESYLENLNQIDKIKNHCAHFDSQQPIKISRETRA